MRQAGRQILDRRSLANLRQVTDDEYGVEGVDVVRWEEEQCTEERTEAWEDQKYGIRDWEDPARHGHRDHQGQRCPHHVDGVEGCPEVGELVGIFVKTEVLLDEVQVDGRLTLKMKFKYRLIGNVW